MWRAGTLCEGGVEFGALKGGGEHRAVALTRSSFDSLWWSVCAVLDKQGSNHYLCLESLLSIWNLTVCYSSFYHETMAEGTVPRLEAVDLEESVATMEVTVLEALPGPAEEVSLDVWPKEQPVMGQGPPKSQESSAAGQSGTGEQWMGPLGTVDYWVPPPTGPMLTPSGAHFSQWRDRRISDNDWSYSTAVGSQTIEVLQEMFGAAAFRDPGHRSGWQDTNAMHHPPHESHPSGEGVSHFWVSSTIRQYETQEPLRSAGPTVNTRGVTGCPCHLWPM